MSDLALPVRKGISAPPLIPAMDGDAARELLAEVETMPTVRLVELRPRIGMTPVAQKNAIRTGVLEVVPGRGRWEGYAISRDEARTLILATALAVAAGLAVAAMLRGLKGAGLVGVLAAEAIRNLP